MKNVNFIAIDFETATTQRTACQVGITVVKEGEIVKKISRFIQPPANQYSKQCIKVHGITPDITADSPTFDIIWNDIEEYFEGNFIVAHNLPFDIDVLYKELDRYNIPHPIFMGMACTYQLSGMALEEACKVYNIPLCNHHDGSCDADVCALLFLKYLKGELNKPSEKSTNRNKWGIISDRSEIKNSHNIEPDSFNGPLKDFSRNVLTKLHPTPEFINKKIIITGETEFNRNHAYQIIEKLGGKKSSTINKSLNYVVLGKEPGPKKLEQLEVLKNEGYNIKVLSEAEFIKLIESSTKDLRQ